METAAWRQRARLGIPAREQEAMMTSKMIALRVLDSILVVGTGGLILSIAGLPMDWLSNALDMSAGEFRAFAIFMVFAALWLMHAIASSDSAP
jgi:hypothetical protein